jgi:peptidoglycan hydrolase-like protein with peptidoglycan-binding domain
MKIRMIVAATTAALFSLGAMAAGDDKQKQSQSSQGQSASQPSSSGSASGSTAAQSSKPSSSAASGASSGQSKGQSAASGASSGQSQKQAQGGQRSDLVKQVQQKLSEKGHQVQADGVMGPKTQAALKEFQEKQGLQGDGQLNRETLSALGVSASGSAAMGGSSSGQSKGSAASGSSSMGQSKGQSSSAAGSSSGQAQKKQ